MTRSARSTLPGYPVGRSSRSQAALLGFFLQAALMCRGVAADAPPPVGAAGSSPDQTKPTASITTSATFNGADDYSAQEGKKSGASIFRLAQVTPGQTSSSSSVAGQVSSSPDSSNAETLQEVLVTAQKREERLQDVPISISVLSGKDLDASAVSGVTAALVGVPALAAQMDNFGGGTQLSLRGVSNGQPLAGGASTVAYYIDGVPFGLIRNSFVPDPNIYDLQQIEVLKGPQGTLYGANALNGVIRVLTHDADLDSFDIKIHALDSQTAGGGNNYRGDLAINAPIVEGKVAARLIVGYEGDSGWIDAPFKKNINDARLKNYRLKINAQPTDELSIGLTAWRSNNRYGAASDSQDNDRALATRPEPISSDFGAYGLKIGYELPMLSISSVTSLVDYSDSGVVNLAPQDAPQIDFDTRLDSRIASEELNLQSKLQGPWRWSAGVFYRDARDEFKQHEVSYPELSLFPVDDWIDTSKSVAVYGEVGRRFLGDALELSAGLRYYHDDEGTQAVIPPAGATVSLDPFKASSSATTPRVVLTWKPDSNTTFYASYSQGFRSGAYQEEQIIAYAPSFGPVKPDKLLNYELGAKGEAFDHRLTYSAAVYYIQWRDIQQVVNVPVPSLGPGFTINPIINGNAASGPGAEFEATLRPVDSLQLSANFSWSDLTFDSPLVSGGVVLFDVGSRPNFSPKYTAGGSVKYSFPLGDTGYKSHLSASASYVTSQSFANLVNGQVLILTGASMFNGQLGLAVEAPNHITATLYANNVTNERGTPYPYFVPDWSFRVRPRTIGLQLDYHLK